MEEKSKRAETVRPQFGEGRESQCGCDGVKTDGNDIELNDERDEDMEDGETGFDDWSAQANGLPTNTKG